MNIRKYQVDDKQYLQKICIKTAKPQKNQQGEALLNLLYNDYYTEQEPECCFVLTDNNDIAVGYIICAKNFYNYKKAFTKIYMPQIKKLSYSQYLLKKLSLHLDSLFAKKYPAHLHIDINPDYTGKGSGSKLMNALLSFLKDEKVNGIMLGVNNKNTRAISFYKKHGFNTFLIFAGSHFMGKTLVKQIKS